MGILIALGLFAVAIVVYSAFSGWEMRKAAWDYFAPGRFRGDIQRNYEFGTLVLREGWLNLYDRQGDIIREAAEIENRYDRNRALQAAMNYSPLRALIFAQWAKSTGEPTRTPLESRPYWKENDEDDPQFNAWLSNFNSALALAGAVAAGLLVHHWTRRRRDPEVLIDDRTLWQQIWPIVAAVIAFAVFWYNPAGLVLAHGWPSPNAWVLPFFLWALLLASWEWWFVSGVIIGIGAMAQGQHLLVAPVFLLWPIFAGQPMRAVRWLSGFAIAFMGIVAGWMLTIRPDDLKADREINGPAVWWIAGSALALALLPLFRRLLVRLRQRRADQSSVAADDEITTSPEPLAPAEGNGDLNVAELTDPAPAAAARRDYLSPALTAVVVLAVLLALTWPLLPMVKTHAPMVLGALMWTGALICLLWFAGWRAMRYGIPLVVAIQLLLCMELFGASDSWWLVGFKYGTERHYEMAVGTANNLGALLRTDYGFEDLDEVITTIQPATLLGLPREPLEISMRMLMLTIYGVTLVIASIAAAIQWRRRDPNFLLAATVPWVLFALLPPQMHERYLGFAGLAAAVWIGARGGVGWTLLGGFISFVAYGQIARCMSFQGRGAFNALERRGEDLPFFNNDFFEQMEAATPGVTWALLLGMLMVLFASFLRARTKRRQAQVVEEPAAEREDEPQSDRAAFAEPLPA
jgi:hypothetical protein